MFVNRTAILQISKMREDGCNDDDDIIHSFSVSQEVSPILKSKMVIKIFSLAQSFKVGEDVISALYEKALSNKQILAFFGVYYLLENELLACDYMNKTNHVSEFQKQLADFIIALCTQHDGLTYKDAA